MKMRPWFWCLCLALLACCSGEASACGRWCGGYSSPCYTTSCYGYGYPACQGYTYTPCYAYTCAPCYLVWQPCCVIVVNPVVPDEGKTTIEKPEKPKLEEIPKALPELKPLPTE